MILSIKEILAIQEYEMCKAMDDALENPDTFNSKEVYRKGLTSAKQVIAMLEDIVEVSLN